MVDQAQASRDEEQAVLPVVNPSVKAEDSGNSSAKTSSNGTLGRRLGQHMSTNVDPRWADLILIMCFYVSGLVDSVAFNVWSCFASMQTGNTIFVGLGVSNQPFNAAPYGWAKSLIAIICFLVGAFSFANFHRYFGPTRRFVLVASFGLQTTLIIIAAILATTGIVSTRISDNRELIPGTSTYSVRVDEINWKDLAPLAMLAFQSSGQVVASRMLQYNELPTVVLTSLYCDLMSDANLLTAGLTEDAKRNRRAVAAVFLFVGAISGGYLTKNWVGLAGALWLAAFLKGCMVVSWIFWKSAKKSA